MAQPKTLRDLAGVASEPPDASDAALVLIDCQHEYIDGLLPLHGVESALAEGSRVLDFARSSGIPILHVQQRGREGGLFDPTTARFAIAEAVKPADGERVIEKGLPNAFAGTDLQQALEATGRKNLIVAGFMTHMCVSSTVRAALDLGYASTVVAGACATRDLPDGQGDIVPADTLHRCALAALGDRFATVLPNTAGLART